MARQYWVCVEADDGGLSDSFRVRLADADQADGDVAGAEEATVEDLKEAVLRQAADALGLSIGSSGNSAGAAPPSTAWLFLSLQGAGKGEEGERGGHGTTGKEKEEHAERAGWRTGPGAAAAGERPLRAHETLRSLPADAGKPHMQIVARLRRPSVGGSGSGLRRAEGRQGRGGSGPSAHGAPQTLFQRGIAGADEPEHIRNALELTDLYPGGRLPRTGPNEFNLHALLKILLVAAAAVAFAAALMYVLGSLVPLYAPDMAKTAMDGQPWRVGFDTVSPGKMKMQQQKRQGAGTQSAHPAQATGTPSVNGGASGVTGGARGGPESSRGSSRSGTSSSSGDVGVAHSEAARDAESRTEL